MKIEKNKRGLSHIGQGVGVIDDRILAIDFAERYNTCLRKHVHRGGLPFGRSTTF